MSRTAIVFTTLTLLVPSAVAADDLTDLRAADEAMVRGHNELDATLATSLRHSQSVTFVSNAVTANDRSTASTEELLEAQKRAFAAREWQRLTPRNMQYRIIGDTGIAWGFQRNEIKPKTAPLNVTEERVMRVFAKVNGRWMLVASHFSAVPK